MLIFQEIVSCIFNTKDTRAAEASKCLSTLPSQAQGHQFLFNKHLQRYFTIQIKLPEENVTTRKLPVVKLNCRRIIHR